MAEVLFFVIYHFPILFQIVYPSRQLQRNDISEKSRFNHEGDAVIFGFIFLMEISGMQAHLVGWKSAEVLLLCSFVLYFFCMVGTMMNFGEKKSYYHEA